MDIFCMIAGFAMWPDCRLMNGSSLALKRMRGAMARDFATDSREIWVTTPPGYHPGVRPQAPESPSNGGFWRVVLGNRSWYTGCAWYHRVVTTPGCRFASPRARARTGVVQETDQLGAMPRDAVKYHERL